jgi:hypothetical protein
LWCGPLACIAEEQAGRLHHKWGAVMFETLLADGLVSGAGEKVAAFVVKCLAVAGGFLVGYFLGGVIAWALDRWVFAHKAPEPLKKAVAIVCAIALALLVALIVFGEGGGGLFGGGGGSGTGTPGDDKSSKPAPTPPDAPKKDEIPPPKPVDPVTPTKPADAVIHVTILGGADVPDGERFYLIDGDTARKTFDELKQLILARKQKEKGTLGLSIHFRPKNAPSLEPTHYSISQLTKWAKDVARMDVTFAAPK